MKTYTFKILKKGDTLCGFTSNQMVIKTSKNEYHFYEVIDFKKGNPNFYKDFEIATLSELIEISSELVLFKDGERYLIHEINKIENNIPILNSEFCIIVAKGAGSLKIHDSETDITTNLPAKMKKSINV